MQVRQAEGSHRGRFDPILVLIVLFGMLGGGAIVAFARNWAIMPDELIYIDQVRALLAGHPTLPGLTDRGFYHYQQLYPLLISPLVGLLKLPDAYQWIALLNAWLLASAAVPAYMLARLVTDSRAIARWVALCAIATPWLVFASKVVPDAAAYAVFTWAIWAIVRTAAPQQRQLVGDAWALVALCLAYTARTQFVMLLAVWLFAIAWSSAASALQEGGPAQALWQLIRLPLSRPVPIGATVLMAVAYLVEPGWILGYYLATVSTPTAPGATLGLWPELVNHANAVAFGLAALPVVLGLPWLLDALVRPAERRQNDAAAVILITTALALYVGTTFDMRFDASDRVIERYLFYIAPLWFVAMGAFFARPPRSLAGFALPALAGVVLLIATEPHGVDSELNYAVNRIFSPTQVTLVGWQKAAEFIGSSISGLVVLLMLALCATIWILLRRGRNGLAATIGFGFVAAVLITATSISVPKAVRAQNAAADRHFGERTTAQKAWIEVATGGKPWSLLYSPGSVTELPGRFRRDAVPRTDRTAWRDAAFWSDGLSRVYVPYATVPGDTTSVPGIVHTMAVDWASGRITRAAGDDAHHLLMAKGEQHFAPHSSGPPVEHDDFTLYRLPPRPTAAWAMRGITPSGWVYPRGATLRIYGERVSPDGPATGGVVKVEVTAHKRDQKRARVITSATLRAPTGGHVDLRIPRGPQQLRITDVAVSRVSSPRRPRGSGR